MYIFTIEEMIHPQETEVTIITQTSTLHPTNLATV